MIESAGELNIENIALQIKSLEQRMTSVTLPRTATVLELKHEIQSAIDVESNRQRLIFQGKVLKDDKNLTDYANLDNGKVIHLVIRPVDAPHNPLNDDPNSEQTRFGQRGGPRSVPSFMRSLPMMEGYALITLDSTFSDVSPESSALLSSIMNSLSPNRQRMSIPTPLNVNSRSNSNASTPAQQPNTTENNSSIFRTSTLFQRTPLTFSYNHLTGSNNNSNSNTNTNNSPFQSLGSERFSTAVPYPSSVELRLVRTMGSIRNVRSMLENPAAATTTTTATTQEDSSTLHHSSAEQLAEIRCRLRESGSTQSEQVGMVLGELVDLMTEMAPRMREFGTSLRNTDTTLTDESASTASGGRRVNNMTRMVQGMSLISHYLGSILASTDLNNTQPSTTTSTTSTTTAAAATPPTTRSSTRHRLNVRRSSRTSAGSSSTTATSSSTSSNNNQTNSSKRKSTKETVESLKKSKGNDGKGKSKD